MIGRGSILCCLEVQLLPGRPACFCSSPCFGTQALSPDQFHSNEHECSQFECVLYGPQQKSCSRHCNASLRASLMTKVTKWWLKWDLLKETIRGNTLICHYFIIPVVSEWLNSWYTWYYDVIYWVHKVKNTFFWDFCAISLKLIYRTLNAVLIRQQILFTFHEAKVLFREEGFEIKQKQLLFVQLSGENLQINLPVFSFFFQLGLSALPHPFMSLSQCPLWVYLSVFTSHLYSVYTLHPTVAACKHHMMFTMNRISLQYVTSGLSSKIAEWIWHVKWVPWKHVTAEIF